MTRSHSITIQGAHFLWGLRRRGEIWYADGRSGNGGAGLGRYSLETADYAEALEKLKLLDHQQAAKRNLVPRGTPPPTTAPLTLEEGRRIYLEHVQRPPVVRGVRPRTATRYKAVFDKFVAFARSKGVSDWSQVGEHLLVQYAAWLDCEDYEYATQYLELTTIKQCIKHLVDSGLIPPSCRAKVPLKKPQDTTAYCYTDAEVQAILEHCRTPERMWLYDLLVLLAFTGMRIGEAAALKANAVDLANGFIEVVDQSRTGSRSKRQNAPTTKGGRTRRIPIVHEPLREVLERRLKARPQDGLVFHGPRGGPIKPDTIRNILKREVLKPLAARFPRGDEEKGLTDGRLHSFRHYFVSTCVASGVAEAQIMQWTGHRDSKMVKRYTHPHEQASRLAMQRVAFPKMDYVAPATGSTVDPAAAQQPQSGESSAD